MASSTQDIAVIGGGIVGLATARALSLRPRLSTVLLEAEAQVATHQSGRNSGVVHSGLYYAPGSLKARLCVEGRRQLLAFCREEGIPFKQRGKLVVATTGVELQRLEDLERRGRANGLEGLRRLSAEEMVGIEPHVAGLGGLLVPETGVVDFRKVARRLAERLEASGVEVRTGSRVLGCRRRQGALILETESGEVVCRLAVNCAGLQSDRVARLCGARPGLRIIPFRGEYVELGRPSLVKSLIYPVPDPRFPFLGVHLTRTMDDRVEAGPNAILAFRREGYSRWSFSVSDAAAIFGFPGFWRMARSYAGTGVGEIYRSLSRRALLKDLQRLVPEIRIEDLGPGGCGVRAQAVEEDGSLVDDFRILESERAIHVLNAPSPAATASLRIGAVVAERVAAALAELSR